MTFARFLTPLLLPVLGMPAAAYHPSFHETQTRMALRMIPRGMAEFLAPHSRELLVAARGVGNAQPCTAADVEEQFIRVVRLTEEKRRPSELAREMGVLAHMVQLFMDPSTSNGVTALRENYERFGQEKLSKLVVTREPFWAASGTLDPHGAIERISAEKAERHQLLLEHFDRAAGKRSGTWDDLSVPFALLQTSFSSGVNTTANLYTLLWRACGNRWLAASGQ